MPVEILMPELGESVHEGTVSRWLKREGDFVKEDEPVVEIMTDKVNTELPSPASGILSKILIQEGDTVEVFHAMGIIEEQFGEAREAGEAGKASEAREARDAKPLVEAHVPDESGDKKWFTPVVKAIARDHG